jgi:hypothetical protein
VVGDEVGGADLAGFQGPLAGITAAMARAETPGLLPLPCDAPLAPTDLDGCAIGGGPRCYRPPAATSP